MDNVQLNENTTPGKIIATKEVGLVQHELIVMEFSDGAGNVTEVSAATPLPVIDNDAIAQLVAILAKIIAAPSTAALQSTGNTSLASIDGKLTNPLPVSLSAGVTLTAGDIEIGGVELKNGTDDTRATVTPANALKVDGSAVTQPVSGTFFQVTQPVSNASLPLPTGASTETTLASILAKIIAAPATSANQATQITSLANLDVALSTRLKPADTLAAVTAVTAITNALPAGTNILGKVGIDQTTPGTTNGVQVNAGTAEIGNVKNSGTFAVQATPVTQADTFMLGGVNVKEINAVTPLMGAGNTGTGSLRVTVATDQVSIPVAATLTAETTKVIGTVNVSAAQTIATVTNVTTLGTITNNVNTVEVAPTTVLHGKTSVTTAGTRVVLAASTACKSVTIKALSTNTGFIYVGSSTVSSANGFQLSAGDVISLDVANLNTINIDSSVSAESVSYLGVN